MVQNRRAKGRWSSHATRSSSTCQVIRRKSIPRDLRTLRCLCNPEKAVRTNRGCLKSTCLGNCTLYCGCHYFLPPPPSRATGANSTGDAGGGDSNARGRSHNMRSVSMTNHRRGGYTASHGRGGANRASSTSGAPVHPTHGEKPYWHDGGREAVGGTSPGQIPSVANDATVDHMGTLAASRGVQPGFGLEIQIQNAAGRGERTRVRKREMTTKKISRFDVSPLRVFESSFLYIDCMQMSIQSKVVFSRRRPPTMFHVHGNDNSRTCGTTLGAQVYVESIGDAPMPIAGGARGLILYQRRVLTQNNKSQPNMAY